MIGLTGEVGVDVQSNVEGDPDPDQDQAITRVLSMEETTVQEVLQKITTATLIPVQVGHSCFSNFGFEIWSVEVEEDTGCCNDFCPT